MVVTRELIVSGLKNLGLKRGDIVLVHSALSALGQVEGGADTVIDALLETVGPQGTVVMPYPLGGAVIAKVFSERPGVVRSFHPTHAVTAQGAWADEITRDHLKSPTAAGKETPYGRIADLGGYVLLLGVDQDRNTTLHTAEEYADAPYLSDHTVTYTDQQGKKQTVVLKKYPGPHRDFIGLDRFFRKTGIMRVGKIGQAVARLMKSADMIRVALDLLRKDPAAVLCNNPNCADCVMQRGRIKAARLSRESFSLAVVAEEVTPETSVLMAALPGEGIRQIELGKIGGHDLAAASEADLVSFKKTLAENRFSVAVARGGTINGQKSDKVLKAALALGARMVVVSAYLKLDGNTSAVRDEMIERLKQMAAAADGLGIALLIENAPGTYCDTANNCEEMISAVGSPNLKLAFNPANFARVGLKPFLGIPSRVRKLAGLLYVNDALFSGQAVVPGFGNAEIKELISILRCRSFDGVLSLRADGSVDGFRKTAFAFWRLLETM